MKNLFHKIYRFIFEEVADIQNVLRKPYYIFSRGLVRLFFILSSGAIGYYLQQSKFTNYVSWKLQLAVLTPLLSYIFMQKIKTSGWITKFDYFLFWILGFIIALAEETSVVNQLGTYFNGVTYTGHIEIISLCLLLYLIFTYVVYYRSNKSNQSHNYDAPIKSIAEVNEMVDLYLNGGGRTGKREDYFQNLRDSVKQIEENFIDNNIDRTSVICLDGVWGSGKTSVVNILKEQNADKLVILHFETWHYSNIDELIESFFSRINFTIESNYGFSVLDDSQELIEVLTATNKFSGLKGIISSKTEISRFNNLSNKLGRLSKFDKKLIIVVDDIDRLDEEERDVIFKLIHLLSDLPNLIVICPFSLQKLMREPRGGSKKFEKIINFRRRINKYTFGEYQVIFESTLYNLVNSNAKTPPNMFYSQVYDIESIEGLWKQVFWDLLAREIKRLLSLEQNKFKEYADRVIKDIFLKLRHREYLEDESSFIGIQIASEFLRKIDNRDGEDIDDVVLKLVMIIDGEIIRKLNEVGSNSLPYIMSVDSGGRVLTNAVYHEMNTSEKKEIILQNKEVFEDVKHYLLDRLAADILTPRKVKLIALSFFSICKKMDLESGFNIVDYANRAIDSI